MPTPAQQAEAIIAEAEAAFEKRDFDQSYQFTKNALGLRRAVETHPAPAGFPVQGDTLRDHRLYTDVMRRAFVLLLKLGKSGEAKKAYDGALAWADDQECSSKRLFDAVESDWANRAEYWRVSKEARRCRLSRWLTAQFA